MTTAQPPLMTMTAREFAAFAALPANAERKLELLNGKLIERMPNSTHAALAFHIAVLLGSFIAAQRAGRGLIEQRIRLPGQPGYDLIPDIAFVQSARVPLIVPDAPLGFMPDLCIEIHSPGQTEAMLREKATFYLAHGAQTVWILYPEKRVVDWLTPGAAELLSGADLVTGGAALPGFSATVEALLAVV